MGYIPLILTFDPSWNIQGIGFVPDQQMMGFLEHSYPIGSMYGIFTYIYQKNDDWKNVGIGSEMVEGGKVLF